jgi:hypothetical protein
MIWCSHVKVIKKLFNLSELVIAVSNPLFPLAHKQRYSTLTQYLICIISFQERTVFTDFNTTIIPPTAHTPSEKADNSTRSLSPGQTATGAGQGL